MKRNLLLLFISACTLTMNTIAQDLGWDSKVKKGQLPNGLTYYIRENPKPEKKVELRLVVKVGSIMEDDDQQGLAHMAEHMAFNGTTHFKKNDIVSFLQDIGVGFGSDLNAFTGFDETVYILPIPTDKPDNLEKGFRSWKTGPITSPIWKKISIAKGPSSWRKAGWERVLLKGCLKRYTLHYLQVPNMQSACP